MHARIRIESNIDLLNEEEHIELDKLLMKAGFQEVCISGGALDFVIELDGPELEVTLQAAAVSMMQG